MEKNKILKIVEKIQKILNINYLDEIRNMMKIFDYIIIK